MNTRTIFLLSIFAIILIAGCSRKTAGSTTIAHENDITQITAKRWFLVKLSELPSDFKELAKQPHITFSAVDKRIQGFGGCNNFFGQYELSPTGEISIENIATNKKFCLKTMEIEKAFLKMLNLCHKLSLQDDSLILEKKDGKILGVFTRE
jgi:copper homeostasis protein (lipoprotein)